MDNFQLYRTNILLGGQMAWNLILQNNEGKLDVADIHLAPVNIKIPKYSDENLLNYSHHENVKAYYNSIKDSFYKKHINYKLQHNWVVMEDNYNVAGDEIYEDSLEAGPKTSMYGVYGKTIEILCPLWLEKLAQDEILSFKLEVISKTGTVMGEKYISFDDNTRFGKYFRDYIEYIGLCEGSDDVLNVNLNNKKLSVSGLDVKTGNIVSLDKSYLIHNILYRERPLMELDTMLINIFSDNNIIAKQLFNFNFCFNLDDIVSEYTADLMYGHYFNYKITAYISSGDDVRELPKRDFYSNYEYIRKADITRKKLSDITHPQTTKTTPAEEPYELNVLSYLRDDRYIGHMASNKFVQDVCHWSLYDNKDYLFNIYNGFGSYEYSDDKYIFYSHNYKNTPDLITTQYNRYLNNTGWCAGVDVDAYEDFLPITNRNNEELIEKIKRQSSDFSQAWVNNVYYGEDQTRYKTSGFLVMVLFAEESTYKDIENFVKNNDLYKELVTNALCCFRLNSVDNQMYILVNTTDPDKEQSEDNEGDEEQIEQTKSNMDNITFKSFVNLLAKITYGSSSIDKSLAYLYDRMTHVKPVPAVVLNKSLYIIPAPGPSINKLSNEVEYYRNETADINDCYVLRYDGKIKPTFITDNESLELNNIYFKKVITQDEFKQSEFTKYMYSKYPPMYKSLGYYCIHSKKRDKFDKYSALILTLKPVIELNITDLSINGKPVALEDYIYNYLRETFQLANPEEIYERYDIIISPNTSGVGYGFNIKLTLK